MKTIFLTATLVVATILIGKAGSKAGMQSSKAGGCDRIFNLEGRDDLIKFFLQEKAFDFQKAYKGVPKEREGC
jgi:hypothetical protein